MTLIATVQVEVDDLSHASRVLRAMEEAAGKLDAALHDSRVDDSDDNTVPTSDEPLGIERPDSGESWNNRVVREHVEAEAARTAQLYRQDARP